MTHLFFLGKGEIFFERCCKLLALVNICTIPSRFFNVKHGFLHKKVMGYKESEGFVMVVPMSIWSMRVAHSFPSNPLGGGRNTLPEVSITGGGRLKTFGRF